MHVSDVDRVLSLLCHSFFAYSIILYSIILPSSYLPYCLCTCMYTYTKKSTTYLPIIITCLYPFERRDHLVLIRRNKLSIIIIIILHHHHPASSSSSSPIVNHHLYRSSRKAFLWSPTRQVSPGRNRKNSSFLIPL